VNSGRRIGAGQSHRASHVCAGSVSASEYKEECRKTHRYESVLRPLIGRFGRTEGWTWKPSLGSCFPIAALNAATGQRAPARGLSARCPEQAVRVACRTIGRFGGVPFRLLGGCGLPVFRADGADWPVASRPRPRQVAPHGGGAGDGI
jgi:hypothetical protein